MQSSLIDSIPGMDTISGESVQRALKQVCATPFVGLLGDIMREHAHCFPSLHLATEVEHLGALKSGESMR